MRIIILVGFLSCLNYVKASNPVIKNDSISIIELENEFNFQNDTIVNDTLIIGAIKFVFTTIRREDFFDAVKNYQGFSNEQMYNTNYNEKFDDSVSRKDMNTLIFKLKNGKDYELTNEPAPENAIGGACYRYICHLQSLKSFLVAGFYYEAEGCVLIDDSFGLKDEETLLHFISIEPSNKLLITYYWDGWAYTSGEFILYKIENRRLEKIVSILNTGPKVGDYYWSMSNVYFTRSDEIVFIRQFYNPDPYKEMKCFTKMTIIE